jgi:hypothetical protein
MVMGMTSDPTIFDQYYGVNLVGQGPRPTGGGAVSADPVASNKPGTEEIEPAQQVSAKGGKGKTPPVALPNSGPTVTPPDLPRTPLGTFEVRYVKRKVTQKMVYGVEEKDVPAGMEGKSAWTQGRVVPVAPHIGAKDDMGRPMMVILVDLEITTFVKWDTNLNERSSYGMGTERNAPDRTLRGHENGHVESLKESWRTEPIPSSFFRQDASQSEMVAGVHSALNSYQTKIDRTSYLRVDCVGSKESNCP